MVLQKKIWIWQCWEVFMSSQDPWNYIEKIVFWRWIFNLIIESQWKELRPLFGKLAGRWNGSILLYFECVQRISFQLENWLANMATSIKEDNSSLAENDLYITGGVLLSTLEQYLVLRFQKNFPSLFYHKLVHLPNFVPTSGFIWQDISCLA